MPVTLNSNLLAQLDSETRQPILEVVSAPSTGSSIPFIGQKLHTVEDAPESMPDCFAHSTGQYVAVYMHKEDDSNTFLYLQTSDAGRTSWNTPVNVTVTSGVHNENPSCCELTTGNIGIVWSERNNTVYTLKWKVVTIEGTTVSSGTISSTGIWYESSVKRLTDGADPTYILVAAQKNGSSWNLVKFTHVTGTWSAWSAGANLFSGTAATDERRNPFIQEIVLAGPTYQQWLLFDKVDAVNNNIPRKNVYYTKTAGATKLTGALTVAAVTTNTDNFKRFEDPSAVRVSSQAADTAYFAYVLRSSSILLGRQSTPALNGDNAWFIWYDPANDWIIMTDQMTSPGINPSNGVYVINASDLSIKKRYFNSISTLSTTSTPKLHSTAGILAAYYDSPRLVIGFGPGGWPATNDIAMFDVIDIVNDTVTPIFDNAIAEEDIPEGGKRVNYNQIGNPWSLFMEGTKIWWVDEAVGNNVSYVWGNKLRSFDYAESQDLTIVPRDHGNIRFGTSIGTFSRVTIGPRQHGIFWSKNERCGYACFPYISSVTPGPGDGDWAGRIIKFNFDGDGSGGTTTSGGAQYSAVLVYTFHFDNVTDFPKAGASTCCVVNGYLYFGIAINTTSLPLIPIGTNRWGVGHCSPDGGGSATIYDDYPFDDISTTGSPARATPQLAIKPKGDGRVLVCTRHKGIGAYQALADPADLAEEIWNANTLPGWPTVGGQSVICSDVAFDGGRNRAYAALGGAAVSEPYGGILIFDLDGDITQPQYKIGSTLSVTPSFAPADPGSKLVVTDQDYGITICKNGSDNGIAAFWTRVVSNSATDETDLIFDEDIGQFDLLPYITDRIVTMQNLEHEPNRAEFDVVPGSLFDPLNQRSLYKGILDFGRKITIRKGERVNGIDYLVDAFTGYIESGSISYARGSDKKRHIVMFDVSKASFDYEVPLSPPYGSVDFPLINKPDGDFPSDEGIIADMANRLMKIPEADISIGTFPNSQSGLFVQLTGLSPADMTEVVANRFRRVTYVNNSGLFTVKEIDPSVAVSDVLPDHKLIFEMNPNENEGESTNRITVKGVSLDAISVLYPEELILSSLSGYVSFGASYSNDWSKWYPYSADLSRKATNPRIRIIYWEGAPNLAPPYIKPWTADEVIQSGEYTDLLSQMTAGEAADFLNYHGVRLFRQALVNPIPVGLLSFTVDVYAQDVGSVAGEIQATADDVEHQQKMRGHVVERIVEFPLATTVSECQMMADWFMYRVKLARRIVSIKMAGHLQHEPGDVIQFNHPESGDPMKGVIHQINREYGIGHPDTQTLTVGVFE